MNRIDSIIFSWLFFQITTNDFIYRIAPNFFIPSFIMAIMPTIAAWICIFGSIKKYISIHKDILIFFTCVSSMLLSVILGNDFIRNIVFSSSFFMLMTTCIFIYTRRTITFLFQYMKEACIFSGIIVCIYANTFSGMNYIDMENSYMAIGYCLSLFSIILFEWTRIYNQKASLIFAFIFSVNVLIFGNRGAFIVLIMYCFIRIWIIKSNGFTKNGVCLCIILILTILIGTLYIDSIINIINIMLYNIGISSRSLEKLLTHSFIESSGRMEIYEKALTIIKSDPLVIREPGFLTTTYISERYINANAHNLLLELLVEYGCVVGSCIFLWMMCKILQSIRLLKNKSINCSIAACFLIQALVQLSFSATFYSSNELWLGFVIFGISARRENYVKGLYTVFKDNNLVKKN